MTYALEQRMRMLDFLLANFTAIGPRHLIDFFGISLAQATRDFALYNELHPGNMVFVSNAKSWHVTPGFKRVYP